MRIKLLMVALVTSVIALSTVEATQTKQDIQTQPTSVLQVPLVTTMPVQKIEKKPVKATVKTTVKEAGITAPPTPPPAEAIVAAVTPLPEPTPTPIPVVTPTTAPVASGPRSGCGDNEYAAFIYGNESGGKIPGNCNPSAQNAGGCLGIGQACPGSKVTAACPNLDYDCENKFFTEYAISRYGSWLGAYQFWVANNWW